MEIFILRAWSSWLGRSLYTGEIARSIRAVRTVFSCFQKTKMDPRDFDFTLRSGIGAPGQSTGGAVDWNSAMTMMAISSVFLEKATKDAAEYARHANRPVYGKDIVLALKYNALPASGFWNGENLGQKVGEWRERLAKMMEESDTSSDEDEADETMEEEGEWSPVIADSPVVRGMNSAEVYFEAWQPSSEVDHIVHRAITRAANRL